MVKTNQRSPAVKKKLVVGTKETPPFAMKDADGNWTGISIDLWRQIADRIKFIYEWRELDQYGLADRHCRWFSGCRGGKFDHYARAGLDKFDFTYPFYTTGLGIAVAGQDRNAAYGHY